MELKQFDGKTLVAYGELLIAPYGIETTDVRTFEAMQRSTNRTLWN